MRACGRVVELSTVTRTVDWDTDLVETGAHTFFPAVRPDGSGNLVIVYAESGTKITPTLVAIGRTPDGAFTLHAASSMTTAMASPKVRTVVIILLLFHSC